MWFLAGDALTAEEAAPFLYNIKVNRPVTNRVLDGHSLRTGEDMAGYLVRAGRMIRLADKYLVCLHCTLPTAPTCRGYR